jgi:hypothetical protein
MGFISSLFWIKKRREKQYLDAGLSLIQKLVTSLNLPGWENLLPVYSPQEMEAIDKRFSNFQAIANKEVGGEAKFNPDAAQTLKRILAAEALAEHARNSWTYAEEIPKSWKNIVATYLKSWASRADPFILLNLAEFLVKSGSIIEAKETLRVILYFPPYADIYYSGNPDNEMVDKIIKLTKESLEDLK